jgi:hypothetical protein
LATVLLEPERIVAMPRIQPSALVAGLLTALLIGGSAAADQPVRKQPEQAVPQKVEPGSSGSSLGERLSRSGGVIRPPSGIDLGMAQPAPKLAPRSTPIIPPPGTPGGNPRVEPK